MSPQSPYPAVPTPSGGLSTTTEKTVGMLAHLAGIIAAIVSAGWLTFVGPLVVWLVYKDRSALARHASAGAFNFNLAVWAAIILGWVLAFTVILIPVSVIVWLGAAIVGIWCSVKGAVRAGNGQAYSYPFGIPVLS